MENQLNFTIPTVSHLQEKENENSESLDVIALSPNILKEINSLAGTEDFKAGLYKFLILCQKEHDQKQISRIYKIERYYQKFLKEFVAFNKRFLSDQKKFSKCNLVETTLCKSANGEEFVIQARKKFNDSICEEKINELFRFWDITFTCDIEDLED